MISCRPNYLPRDFSSVFFVAVYIPPQSEAGTKTTLNELYSAICKQENAYPETALLVAGDFNAGKLKSVLPNFYQHVKCATRGKGKITFDHLYSTHRDAYNALPRPPFGKSDHNSILRIPAYKLSDEPDANLQDWNMFRDSSDGIEEYTTSVIGFINKCINGVVPTVTVHSYPNQKPWITDNIRTELKARAFKERDTNPEAYKKSCYALR